MHRNWKFLPGAILDKPDAFTTVVFYHFNVTHRISGTSILMFLFRHHDIVFDFVQNLTMKGTQKLKLCDRIHFSIVNQHCLCQGTLLDFNHLPTLAITCTVVEPSVTTVFYLINATRSFFNPIWYAFYFLHCRYKNHSFSGLQKGENTISGCYDQRPQKWCFVKHLGYCFWIFR